MAVCGGASPAASDLTSVINADHRRFSGYFPLCLLVGGVLATTGDIEQALLCLRSTGGLMIRQPLQRIGSPLAACDYHSVSAPWRGKFSSAQPSGRGAAGRPIAKEAFCFALEQILAASGTEASLRQLLADAMSAFSADHSYAVSMARAAVTIAAKKHAAMLRQRLRQAAHQAVSQCDTMRGQFTCYNDSPCGTGDCRFVQGDLAFLVTPSVRGKQQRPANHREGGHFSSDDALAELERLSPFVVPIPIHDGDAGSGADVVAPS